MNMEKQMNKDSTTDFQKKAIPASPVERLVSSMRLLEIDHEPYGWPAVQMKDISALCDLIDNAVPSIDLLQSRLESGEYLSKEPDGKWWLFDISGEGIVGGNGIRDILINLIWIDC